MIEASNSPNETDYMHIIWSLGNTLTALGMIAAICVVFFEVIPVSTAFFFPLPGMLLRVIGSNRYQRAEPGREEQSDFGQ